MRTPIKNSDRFFTELSEVEVIHNYNVDIRNREIFISGEDSTTEIGGAEPGVDHILSARIIRNLRLLTNRSDKPILIHMKTCGGDWNEGMAIYDAIKLCPVYITILNYTHARSMSSIILQAAGNRVMMPHSSFMFHHGTYGDEGEMKTVMATMEWYKRSIDIMCNLYVDSMKNTPHSKWNKSSRDKIRQWLDEQMDKKNDVFLSAADAVQHGFADSVFDGDWAALLAGG